MLCQEKGEAKSGWRWGVSLAWGFGGCWKTPQWRLERCSGG